MTPPCAEEFFKSLKTKTMYMQMEDREWEWDEDHSIDPEKTFYFREDEIFMDDPKIIFWAKGYITYVEDKDGDLTDINEIVIEKLLISYNHTDEPVETPLGYIDLKIYDSITDRIETMFIKHTLCSDNSHDYGK